MARSSKPRKRYVPKQKSLPVVFRHDAEGERNLSLYPHLELMKLKNGVADEAAIHTLAARLNIAYVLAGNTNQSEEAVEVFVKALDAVRSMDARFGKVGKVGATGDELMALGEALNLADELQAGRTRREIRDATEYVWKVAAH